MRGRPRPQRLNIPIGTKPATFKLTDSGVFEEGGVVLSKQGCVIPAQQTQSAAAAAAAASPNATSAEAAAGASQPLLLLTPNRHERQYQPWDQGCDSSPACAADAPKRGNQHDSPTQLQQRRRQEQWEQQQWEQQQWIQEQWEQEQEQQQQQWKKQGLGDPSSKEDEKQQVEQQQKQQQPGQTKLEDLEELGIVGSGSSGVVKKVRHRTTGEVLVFKVIQFDVNNEQLRKQVMTELRSLAGSRHPHVVSYRQSYLANGAVTILMEYMDGGSLADLLGKVPKLPERLLAEVARQVLSGLAYLHGQLRIVHRDIKPSNLLLTSGKALNRQGTRSGSGSGTSGTAAATSHPKDSSSSTGQRGTSASTSGRGSSSGAAGSNSNSNTAGRSGCAVSGGDRSGGKAAGCGGCGSGDGRSGSSKAALKISDFGVSGQLSSSVSKCASWVGTVTYMSPERIRGDTYSFNTDIWSLGMVLVEAATGHFPYPPQGEGHVGGGLGFWELLEYIVVEPAPKLPQGLFSPAFCDFVHACLNKDPSSRPSAAELLRHPWLQHNPPADLGPLLAQCVRVSSSYSSFSGHGAVTGVTAGGSGAAAGGQSLRASGGMLRASGGFVRARGAGGLRGSGGLGPAAAPAAAVMRYSSGKHTAQQPVGTGGAAALRRARGGAAQQQRASLALSSAGQQQIGVIAAGAAAAQQQRQQQQQQAASEASSAALGQQQPAGAGKGLMQPSPAVRAMHQMQQGISPKAAKSPKLDVELCIEAKTGSPRSALAPQLLSRQQQQQQQRPTVPAVKQHGVPCPKEAAGCPASGGTAEGSTAECGEALVDADVAAGAEGVASLKTGARAVVGIGAGPASGVTANLRYGGLRGTAPMRRASGTIAVRPATEGGAGGSCGDGGGGGGRGGGGGSLQQWPAHVSQR